MVSFRQAVLLLGYALIVHGIAQAVAPTLALAQIIIDAATVYLISGVILVGILAFESMINIE